MNGGSGEPGSIGKSARLWILICTDDAENESYRTPPQDGYLPACPEGAVYAKIGSFDVIKNIKGRLDYQGDRFKYFRDKRYKDVEDKVNDAEIGSASLFADSSVFLAPGALAETFSVGFAVVISFYVLGTIVSALLRFLSLYD